MSKKGKQDTAQRFGGEFGPFRKEGTPGVTLSTFKTLVWTSNIGGMLLVVLALEMLFVRQNGRDVRSVVSLVPALHWQRVLLKNYR